VIAACIALFSAVWLMNLTFGVIELPDNLPLVGNLDEAFFSWLFITSIGYLGFNVVPFLRGNNNLTATVLDRGSITGKEKRQ
jgi:hypothetical protein